MMKNGEILTHTFSISNHPIKRFNEPFKIQYVVGLGEFMCYISNFNNRAKLLFEVWAFSILGYVPTASWNYTFDYLHIKTALYVKSSEINISTMRQIFIFDCFYLTSILDPNLLIGTYTFLLDKACGFFTRSDLAKFYAYFQNNDSVIDIPDALQNHRSLDFQFHKMPLKKILIVATMSAGKSTLINALVGYRINKVKTTACTNHLCYIYNKPCEDGLIANIGENKFVYSNDIEFLNSDYFVSAGLHFNSSLSSERICLIDTPGTNYSKDLSHGEITRQAISGNNYDVIIFVSNCQCFGTNDEIDLFEYTVSHSDKPIIFILNQLDRFKTKQDSITKMIVDFKNIIAQKSIEPIVIPISAQAALLMKLDRNTLDEDDVFELAEFEAKLTQDYYDLESYVDRDFINTNKTIISRTGIVLLEQTLKKILYEKS